MSFRRSLNLAFTFVALLVCAVSASAQADLGPQRGSGTSSSQLNITANGQASLQIDISTHASGATVTGVTGKDSTGVFGLDFGDVNALGLGTPTAGVTVDVSSGTGALYTTPITLTPRWAGFGGTDATITVVMDAASGNALGRAATREGAAAASVVAPSVLLPNAFSTNAANKTAITRYVGIFVSDANGAGAVSGALSSRLIYQVIPN
jgi:hypothetical protein